MSGRYSPVPPMAGKDPANYAFDEFMDLARAMSESQESLLLQELNVAPEKPRNGMVVLADGTNWNPGSGAGFYGYQDAWIQLSRGAFFNVKDYGATGDGSTDDTTAIQAAIDAAEAGGVLFFPSPGTYKISTVTVRSSSPVTIIGYGAELGLTDTTNFAINLFGTHHKIFGLKFEPVAAVDDDNDTYRGIKITTDVTTGQSSFVTLRDLHMYNVYQGVYAVMEATATGRVCYRHTLENCIIENYHNQKTWTSSYAVKFDGSSAGDTAGNDSKIIGGIYKGYEKNIIAVKSVGTKIIAATVDGAAVAFDLDDTQHFEVVSCYVEYNTTVFAWSNTPYRTSFFGGTISNFTNLTTGTATDTYLWGADTTANVWGFPLFGRYVSADGVTEIEAINGIALLTPRIYLGEDGRTNDTIYATSAGTPEGNITAGLGSLCSDTTNGKLYVKESGTGNTGWVQK